MAEPTDTWPGTCPICARPEPDMRHVAVECFYDVHEVAPQADKKIVFQEVDDRDRFLAKTRRYQAGTRDEHRIVVTDGQRVIRTDQVPCPPIRLLEVQSYWLTCCKACRGDFLRMFGEWAAGTYVTRSEPDETHNIPVRERGGIVYLSQAEWDARQADRRR